MKELFGFIYSIMYYLVFIGIIVLLISLPKKLRKTTAEKKAKADLIIADSIKADSIIWAKREKDYFDFISNVDSMKMALAQIKGIDKYTTHPNRDSAFIFSLNHPEQWVLLNMDFEPEYHMQFENDSVGRKHAVSKIIELCRENGKEFNKPDKDNKYHKVWFIKGFQLSFSKDSASISLFYRMPLKVKMENGK